MKKRMFISILVSMFLIGLVGGCALPQSFIKKEATPVPSETKIKARVMKDVSKEPDIDHRQTAFDELEELYPKPILHISGFTVYDKDRNPIDFTVKTYYFDVDKDHYTVVIMANGKVEFMNTFETREAPTKDNGDLEKLIKTVLKNMLKDKE